MEYDYLAHWLEDAGWCESNGMGIQGLGWQTLQAWDVLSNVNLDPWEAETLHQASLAYAVSWSEAKDPNCPSPWVEARTDPKVLQDQIKNMFRSMITAQAKPKKGIQR